MTGRPRSARLWLTGIALLAGIASGCRQPPVEEVAGSDLISLLELATVHRETTGIDPDAAEDRVYLQDGWTPPEVPGVTWGVGRRSVARFFLVSVRDLPIVLRGVGEASADGERQTVQVKVNGQSIEGLVLGPELEDYRVDVPSAALVAGWNRLELRYGHWRPGRSVERLAARWEEIRFGDGRPPPAPRAEPGSAALHLPFGTQLEYYLRLAESSRLEIEELAFEDGEEAHLEVLIEPEGGDLTALETLLPGRDLGVDLGASASGVSRLILRSVSPGATGGLNLRRPRIEPPTPAAKRASRPNVIVYLVDALRADRVGAYGHTGSLTPNLDAFAAEALVFREAIAQSSWTKPTVASLFTGLLPPAHGVLRREEALSPQALTLAEVLRAAGYRTIAFSSNPFVSRSFGLDQGFLRFDSLGSGPPGSPHAFSDTINEEVFRWLDEQSAEPFLLYVHTMDPHAPYTPPRPDGSLGGGEEAKAAWQLGLPTDTQPSAVLACREQYPMLDEARRRMIRRYDEEVAFNDASFGRFVAALRARGLYEDSVIVVLSDHGESFWEHRDWRHENNLYSQVIRIPLMIRPPGGVARPPVDELAQQIDVLPTILELLDLPAPAAAQGRSLLATDGESPPRVGFSYLECVSRRRLAAVLAGPWKLIRGIDSDGELERVELYHRRRDPGELTDVSAAEPEVVQRLLRLLEAREAERPLAPRQVEVGEELEETLRALGYVG